MSNILTCVYCGMAYPEGTPPHGAKVLTDHIKVCEKHPMRELEEELRATRHVLDQLYRVVMEENSYSRRPSSSKLMTAIDQASEILNSNS